MAKKTKYLLLLPLVLWLVAFLILPYGNILYQSFFRTDDLGFLIKEFNFDSYIKAITREIYIKTLLKTFGFSIIIALTCVCLSVVLAYFISFKLKKNKQLVYTLIVLPFWMSYIVRAFAWKTILGQSGIINTALLSIGLIEKPLSFILYTDFSVILCLVHIFTPFVAIPVYTAFEQIPKSLIEAGKDLGAGSFAVFSKIILPLALPGIISGATFAMVLTMGDFLTPVLLGGPNSLFISNIVQNLFGTANDKPLGSAIGILLLALIFILLEISARYEKKHQTIGKWSN